MAFLRNNWTAELYVLDQNWYNDNIVLEITISLYEVMKFARPDNSDTFAKWEQTIHRCLVIA